MSFRSDKITSFSGNRPLICGNNILKTDKPLVMGILNLTPDSFYDGGQYTTKDAWIAKTDKMIQEGASIIDIGAISTRPGASEISEDEELSRLLPALETLTLRHPSIVFSIDTYRSKVVKYAAEAGAGMINDISAGKFDNDLFDAVAVSELPYILMHMQGTPSTMQVKPVYKNVTQEVLNFFDQKIVSLVQSGIQQIIIDPGFGFGKSIDHNYQLLKQLRVIKDSGFLVLVGLSRKSMIYKVLEITAEESLPATTALNLQAILNGADILRVHDVKEAVQTIKLADAYMKDLE